MNIQIGIRSDDGAQLVNKGQSLNILVVGNFSGQRPADADASGKVAIQNMLNIDAGDIDPAIQRLKPSLTLSIGDNQLALSFSAIDDFHPDRLFAGQGAFSVISELKQSLNDPAKSQAAVLVCSQMLGRVSDTEKPLHPAVANPPPDGVDETDSEMFTRLLDRASHNRSAGDTKVQHAVDRILDEAGASDYVPERSREIQDLEKDLDAWCTGAMRELLRNESFRQLEAAWRSVQWLGEQVEFEPDWSLWLVDTGTSEPALWASELKARVMQTVGSADLLIILNEFTDTPESLEQLRLVTAVAHELDTRAFAAANFALAGVGSTIPQVSALDGSDIDEGESQAWRDVRADASATRIGLGFPRLLLRQPYGQRSDPVDAFDFEELEINPEHSAFVWGNPGVALAAMSLRQTRQIDDLPMVTYNDGGGQAIKPPAETYLTDSAVERLLQRGLIPFVAQRGDTDVRIPRFQSIAQTPTAL